MMRSKKILSLLLLSASFIFMLLACNNKDGDEIAVARVGDNFLYLDELAEAIPEGAKENDSIFAAQSYIKNWVRQQILLDQAENYLEDKDLDFEKQMEEYRKSLVIFTYEEELVKQKLDTTVTDEDINAYYTKHKEDFVLKKNIVKVIYVKLPTNDPNLSKFRKLVRSNSQDDRLKLSELSKEFAVNYFLDDNSWLFFDDVLREVPIKTYNQQNFLQSNRYVEHRDSLYHYLVNIKAFKMKETAAPVGMQRERIKNVIINRRKTEIINKMMNDLYRRAEEKNMFEIY